MPQERKRAASGGSTGTFDEMYTEAVRPSGGEGGSVWSRPRPVPVEEVEEDLSGELEHVVGRDYSEAMVAKVFDALDYVVPSLSKSNDQAVYMILVRRSFGRGQKTCFVNLPLLAELSNLSLSGAQYAMRRLVGLKLIKKVRERIGKGKEQGAEYEVRVPAGK